MKIFWINMRDRIMAGLVFLVPLFAVFLILQKLWAILSGSGNFLAKLTGLKPVMGSTAVPFVTTVLLIILLYIFGWLVKFRALNSMRDWIETKILQYVPGYLTYKAQIGEKLNPSRQDERIPVWITTDLGKRPGLLITEHADEAIVFFPNSPDSNNGQVFMVSKNRITKLEMSAAALIKSLQNLGKDLGRLNQKGNGIPSPQTLTTE
jgi:uncharacterized membrane protein